MEHDKYLLTRLMEQCAAVQLRAANELHYGGATEHPAGSGITNRRRLIIEMSALAAVCDEMEARGQQLFDNAVVKTKRGVLKRRETLAIKSGNVSPPTHKPTVTDGET